MVHFGVFKIREMRGRKEVMDGMTERDIVRQAQNGNTEAMNELIIRYYPAVFVFFYKNTSQYHQSKDLTQEVFIKMVSSISKYKPRPHFKSWLFTIALPPIKPDSYFRHQ